MGIHATGWRVDPAETPAEYNRQCAALKDLRTLHGIIGQAFKAAEGLRDRHDIGAKMDDVIHGLMDVQTDSLVLVDAQEEAVVEYEARDEPTPAQNRAWHEARLT